MLLSEFKPTKKATRVVENRITEEPMEFGPESGNELYPAGYENDGRLILHVVSELLPRIKDDQIMLDVMKAVDAIEAGKGNKADIKTVMGVYKEAERQGITKKYKDAIGKFDQDYKDDDGEDDVEEGKYGKKKYEAVGTAADPIMDLCDDVGCDPDHPIFQELVRYLDVDQIADFVSDYRRNHDMPEVSLDESDIDQIADVGKVYSKINKMNMDLVDKGMEPEDAQDEACEKYDCDPAMYDKYVEMKRDDREKVKEAGGYYSKPVYDMIEQHGIEKVMHELLTALDADVIQDALGRMSQGLGEESVVEAEHKFTKNSVTEEADDDAARELELYAENDEALYRQSYVPIAKNLSKKFKKGVYDSELAKKLWKYHADRAAQKYGMDHAGGSKEGLRMFSPDTRRAFARSLEDYWHDEMKIGNFMESAVTEYEGASQEDVAGAITHRFKMNTDLLSKALKKEGGIDALIMAIDDVAEWHAGAEELGSSDVSIMVREVMAQLGITERSLSGLRNSSAFDGKDRMTALLDKNKKLNDKEKEEEERIKKATFGEGAMMVCKHCGDEMHKPTTNCECDCNDENGDHWITKESYTENEDKIVKEYKDAGYVTK